MKVRNQLCSALLGGVTLLLYGRDTIPSLDELKQCDQSFQLSGEQNVLLAQVMAELEKERERAQTLEKQLLELKVSKQPAENSGNAKEPTILKWETLGDEVGVILIEVALTKAHEYERIRQASAYIESLKKAVKEKGGIPAEATIKRLEEKAKYEAGRMVVYMLNAGAYLIKVGKRLIFICADMAAEKISKLLDELEANNVEQEETSQYS